MENLNFLVTWGKNKETAWSGTNYSIFKALQKYYSVNDINVNGNRWINAFMRRVLRKDGMSIEYSWRKALRNKLQSVEGKVFQFSEVLFDNDNRETFLYVDNTVSYVNYMRKNIPDVYAVSGFQNSNVKILEKRTKEQDEYIKNNCSGLFTMGQWLREWLIEQGFPANRIFAVGGGYNVDTKLIAPQLKAHNKILFVGKDFNRKGGYITYEAFKLLRNSGKDVELYVIGPSEDPIKDPISGYHFIGQIPFNEEAIYYNMCDVFCLPSYFEAYGLVFVEALTFGLPCIGRNCYEMPYFINDGNTGLLLRNEDPKELADLMLRILCDENFAKNVAKNRSYYIENYSWGAVAKRMAEIIK